jgi:hypothetical protein
MKKTILILCFVSLVLPAWAGECVTKSGYPAAMTESDLDKAIDCAVANDKVALAKLIESGRAIILRAGVVVYNEETKLFKGKVKIRPKGETFSLWTVIEAINCK